MRSKTENWQLSTDNRKLTTDNSRRGAAAVGMVVLMVLLSVIVLGMVLGGAAQQDLAAHGTSSTRAFYAAEAGMNMALHEALTGIDHDGDGVIGGITPGASVQAALHGSALTVQATEAGNTISLASRGQHDQARHAVQSAVYIQPPSGGPAAVHGITVGTTINMSNNSRIDAFDSSTGTWNPNSHSYELATIATNSTGSNHISLSNSATVYGHAYVGPGGNPNSVISTSGSSSIFGDQAAMPESLLPPPVVKPSDLPPSGGDADYGANGSTTITSGEYRYTKFVVSNNHTITIDGDVVVYCDDEFMLQNNATLQLNAGASLTVYADKFEFKNNATFNVPSSPTPSTPGTVELNLTSSNKVAVKNSAHVAAVLRAPQAEVELKNNARIFGAIEAAKVKVNNSGRFTQDLALTGGGSSPGGGGGGGGSGGGSATLMQWVHVQP